MSYDLPPLPPPRPMGRDNQRGAFIHLSGLVFAWCGAGFVGPLLLWMAWRGRSRFADHQGKEAVNFHLTLLLVELMLGFVTWISCGFASPLVHLLLLFLALWLVLVTILAALVANSGRGYRYPFTWRIVR